MGSAKTRGGVCGVATEIVRKNRLAPLIMCIGSNNVKYLEIIADNLSRSGWSWGCVATVDSNGRFWGSGEYLTIYSGAH